nr:hypothetical protein CFP56_24648 [Quercus suber]
MALLSPCDAGATMHEDTMADTIAFNSTSVPIAFPWCTGYPPRYLPTRLRQRPVFADPDRYLHHGYSLSKPAGQHFAATASARNAQQRFDLCYSRLRSSRYTVICSCIIDERPEQWSARIAALITTVIRGHWRIFRSSTA